MIRSPSTLISNSSPSRRLKTRRNSDGRTTRPSSSILRTTPVVFINPPADRQKLPLSSASGQGDGKTAAFRRSHAFEGPGPPGSGPLGGTQRSPHASPDDTDPLRPAADGSVRRQEVGIVEEGDDVGADRRGWR